MLGFGLDGTAETLCEPGGALNGKVLGLDSFDLPSRPSHLPPGVRGSKITPKKSCRNTINSAELDPLIHG